MSRVKKYEGIEQEVFWMLARGWTVDAVAKLTGVPVGAVEKMKKRWRVLGGED